MDRGQLALSLAGVVTVITLFELLRTAGGRWWRGWRARRRALVARAGELEAEGMLRRRGYSILERQPRRRLRLEVDGRPREVELRADLLVARRGRTLVAEVKTGAHAPSLETKATRRQLLEYRVAYGDADGVLLVNVPSGAVQEVTFPLGALRRPRVSILAVALGGALVGSALTAITLLFFG